jgi:hypothetical protein
MVAGARINAFLWNRVSQGYSRVVTDDPPQEGWRAWRRGAADHFGGGGGGGGGGDDGDDDVDAAAREQKPALFRTPACTPKPTPVREPPCASGINDSDAVTDQQTQSQSESPRCGYGGRHDIGRALADASLAAAAIESTSASGAAAVAAARDDDVETIDSMNHEVLAVALDEPQPTQVWQLPFPASEQSSKAASQGTTSTSHRGRRRPAQVMLDFDVPKEMRLTVIHCTFSHVDDVGEDPSRHITLAYGRHAEPICRKGPQGCLHFQSVIGSGQGDLTNGRRICKLYNFCWNLLIRNGTNDECYG